MDCNPTPLEQKRQKAKVLKTFKDFSKNPKLRHFFGSENKQHTEDMIYNTFEWVWKRDVRKPMDSDIITDTDVKRLKRGLEDYVYNIDKRQNVFQQYIKLPKVLARKDSNADAFYKSLEHAQSFNERQMKQGAIHINNLLEKMFSMFKESKNHFSHTEYKKFQKLERDLFFAKDGNQKQNALRELNKFIDKGDPDSSLPANVLIKFQELLTFERPAETKLERDIQSEWNILRTDTARDVLNAAVTTKYLIENFSRASGAEKKHLTNAAEKVQNAIESLIFQTSVDQKSILREGETASIVPVGDFTVYDHETKSLKPYKILNENGERVLAENIKKYSPEYVLEMADVLKDITDFSTSKDRTKWNNITPEQMLFQVEKMVNPTAISNRLKQKHATEKYSSLDPAFYLNRYVNDVANFNFRSRVNLAFTEAASNLINIKRNGSVDAGKYSEYMMDIISEIRGSALNQNRGEINEMDRLVQIINGWEYVSKMGWSVRSGLKNRTQGLYNWVWYGMKGYKRANQFYETNSREGATSGNYTNEEMLHRQMKRFALIVGGKQAAAGIQAATGGSLDMMLIPKGFDIDANGNLVMAKESTMARKVSEEMSRIASAEQLGEALPAGTPALAKAIANVLPGPAKFMAWAENNNRLNTFKIAFANAFLAEKSRKDSHRKAIAEKSGKKLHEVTNKEIYDRVERLSGNQALEMVKTLHFDYNRWAKSRYLQGKTGKVLGQFQHFKFAYFDLMHNMTKDFWRDAKDFNITNIDPISGKKVINESFTRVFRMAALQSLLPGTIGALFGVELGGITGLLGGSSSNLIENPVASDLKMWYDYISADPDLSDEELKKKYDATYGKPAWMTQMGMPIVSDIATLGELYDFWNLVPEEYAELKNMNYNPGDAEWNYNVARVFNVAMARMGWHTIPAVARMDYEKAARITTGAYYPKWLKNWFGMEQPLIPKYSRKIYNSDLATGILPRIKDKKGSKSREDSATLRKKAFAALSTLA